MTLVFFYLEFQQRAGLEGDIIKKVRISPWRKLKLKKEETKAVCGSKSLKLKSSFVKQNSNSKFN